MTSLNGDRISVNGSHEQSSTSSPESPPSSDLIREAAGQSRSAARGSTDSNTQWVRDVVQKYEKKYEKINARAERYAQTMQAHDSRNDLLDLYVRNDLKQFGEAASRLASAEYTIDHLNAQRSKLDWVARGFPSVGHVLYETGVMPRLDGEIKKAREQYDEAVMRVQTEIGWSGTLLSNAGRSVHEASFRLEKFHREEDEVSNRFLGKIGIKSSVAKELERAKNQHAYWEEQRKTEEKKRTQRIAFLEEKKYDPWRSEASYMFVTRQSVEGPQTDVVQQPETPNNTENRFKASLEELMALGENASQKQRESVEKKVNELTGEFMERQKRKDEIKKMHERGMASLENKMQEIHERGMISLAMEMKKMHERG
jgi:hypothetical protein